MSKTAAVYYEREAYGTNGSRLLGRQAAGEGFLKSLVQYGKEDTLFCLAKSEQDFSAFCTQIKPWAKSPRKVTWLPTQNLQDIRKAGTLYRPDPNVSAIAWQRRFQDQRAYSICGVTHTIASKHMQQAIGDLLLAPMQPWDAVICTSQAVKQAYEKVFDSWGGYLAQRIGSKPAAPLQLPIIPLGIDCNAFPEGAQAEASRKLLRDKLGIGPDDIVVLFVGRLIFYAKAHPVPMYLALERAAQQTGQKIHLIQAGWFENEKEEIEFKAAPPKFCPSVNCIFLDGRQPEVRQHVWATADMFVSLSDNIQETFGLTPIEAMANGLPLVVSNWDGYQESIQDGVEGFKIPTVIPPPGSALDVAEAYLTDQMNYSLYIAHPSLATMVDVDACTEAFVKLITDPELRKTMGANGRQRARNVYDWKHIIAAYERLWAELSDIRATAPEMAPLQPGEQPHPLCADPFSLFSHYTPQHLSMDTTISLGVDYSAPMLELVRKDWMTQFGGQWRLAPALTDILLQPLSAGNPVSAQALYEQVQTQIQKPVPEAVFFRTLGHLLKFNQVRIHTL